jgi:hypothetical protein
MSIDREEWDKFQAEEREKLRLLYNPHNLQRQPPEVAEAYNNDVFLCLACLDMGSEGIVVPQTMARGICTECGKDCDLHEDCDPHTAD